MPDLKVVPLQNPATSGEFVIERLEQALAMAKEGQIENCLLVMVTNKNEVVDGWANGNHPLLMMGGLESVKREFMDACIEGRSPNDTY